MEAVYFGDVEACLDDRWKKAGYVVYILSNGKRIYGEKNSAAHYRKLSVVLLLSAIYAKKLKKEQKKSHLLHKNKMIE